MSKSALDFLGCLGLRATWDQDLISQRCFQPAPGSLRQLHKQLTLKFTLLVQSSQLMPLGDKAAFSYSHSKNVEGALPWINFHKFPGGSVQGVWIGSLVRELKPCMLHTAGKNTKNKSPKRKERGKKNTQTHTHTHQNSFLWDNGRIRGPVLFLLTTQ